MKISSKLLSDLKSKNINLDIDHFKLQKNEILKKPPTPPMQMKFENKVKERNQSFNSSDSFEKTTTTINFKIRPCTPNPDALIEKKNEISNSIRSAKTTLTTFPNYKKDLTVTEKEQEDFQFAIQEDDENIFNKEINDETLMSLCNIEPSEFHSVSKLNLKVDLSYNSLQNLGFLLPNLRQLKINGSKMSSLRDIGTSLINLEILWASRCSMQDLSGIMMFQNLKELYISFNQIKDLTDIGFLENLQVLDLEGNEIDLVNAEYLQTLKNLYSLNLLDNPITKEKIYPQFILDILENLEILDEKPKKFALSKNDYNKTNYEINYENVDDSLETLLNKFGKYKGEINISEIKSKAVDMFEKERKNELKEEDLILYSIKKSKHDKLTNSNEYMHNDNDDKKTTLPNRPKTASIFKPENPQKFDSGVSSLVSSNDVAFFGNPLKIFKHKRTSQFIHENNQGVENDYAPNNFMNLINEFRVEKSDDIENFDEDEEEIEFSNEEEENYDSIPNVELAENKNVQNEQDKNFIELENKIYEEKKTNETQKKVKIIIIDYFFTIFEPISLIKLSYINIVYNKYYLNDFMLRFSLK